MTGCRAAPGFIAFFFGSRFQRNRRQRKKPAPLNSLRPANIPPAPARGPLRSASSLAARGERYAFSLTTLGEGSRNRCDSGKDRPGQEPGRPQVRCGTICPRSAHAGFRRQTVPSVSLPSGSRPDRLTRPRCSERFGSFELRRQEGKVGWNLWKTKRKSVLRAVSRSRWIISGRPRFLRTAIPKCASSASVRSGFRDDAVPGIRSWQGILPGCLSTNFGHAGMRGP